MRIKRVLLTLLLTMISTVLIAPVHAQNNPKILRIAAGDEPAILNWYFSGVGSVSDFMHFYMQPPWGREPDNTIVPLLVDELPGEKNGGISQTADGKTVIKFKIADWAVWSDGQPIVADDFKLVYDVATDGVTNFLNIWFVNGAKLDSIKQGATDKDVVITFAGPHPDWTNAGFEPLPAHIMRAPYEAALKNHKGMETMTDYLRSPTFSDGPYIFAEWKAGEYIRFTRNPKFWKTPYFDEIDANFYPDNKVISQLLGRHTLVQQGHALHRLRL